MREWRAFKNLHLMDTTLLLQNIEDLVVDLKSLATAAKVFHEAMQSKCQGSCLEIKCYPSLLRLNLQDVRSWEGLGSLRDPNNLTHFILCLFFNANS